MRSYEGRETHEAAVSTCRGETSAPVQARKGAAAAALPLAAHAAPAQPRRIVLDAALAAGLSGPSRLHDLFLSVDGMTPGQFKQAGQGLQMQWSVVDSLLGPVWLTASARGLAEGQAAASAALATMCSPGFRTDRRSNRLMSSMPLMPD